MEKLKYAGLCAAGFLLNFVCYYGCTRITTYFGNSKAALFLVCLVGIKVCVSIGAIHALFFRIIRKKLQMKTVVYTLSANVFPFVLCTIFTVLLCCGVFNKIYVGWSGLAMLGICLTFLATTIVSGVLGVTLHKNLFK